MITRRKSRELALQMLYQWDVGKASPEEVRETFWMMRGEEKEQYPFALQLFEAAVTEVARIDGMITRHSEHWRLERMPVVDRNVLRLAIAEFLTEPETPQVVVINEALEIARSFSGPESVQFVNGILDQVRKTLEKSEATPPEQEGSPVEKKKKGR